MATELETLCALQVPLARAAILRAKRGEISWQEAALTAEDRLSDNLLAAKLDAVTYPPTPARRQGR
jgi:hypothetical protein